MKKGPGQNFESGGLINFLAKRPLVVALLSVPILGASLAAEMRYIANGDDINNRAVTRNVDDLRDYVSEHVLEGYRMEVIDRPGRLEAMGKLNHRGFSCFLDADGDPTHCTTTGISRNRPLHSVFETQGGGVVACAPQDSSRACFASRDGTYPGFDWVKGGLLTEARVREYANQVLDDLIAQIRAKVADGEADSVDSLD